MLTDEEIKNKGEIRGRVQALALCRRGLGLQTEATVQVFDHNDQGIIEMPEIVLRDLSDESRLQDVIRDARAGLG
jgi:hypothetical protein